MPEQGKVRENSGEGSFRYRRANRSLYLGVEAKHEPNHLKADSFRSFPQDNWTSTALSGKANDLRTRERVVVLDPRLKLEIGKIQWLL